MIDVYKREEDYYNYLEGKFRCHTSTCKKWAHKDTAYCKKCLKRIIGNNEKEKMDEVMKLKEDAPERINIMEGLNNG